MTADLVVNPVFLISGGKEMAQVRDQWTGRAGFIMAAVGLAIGRVHFGVIHM